MGTPIPAEPGRRVVRASLEGLALLLSKGVRRCDEAASTTTPGKPLHGASLYLAETYSELLDLVNVRLDALTRAGAGSPKL